LNASPLQVLQRGLLHEVSLQLICLSLVVVAVVEVVEQVVVVRVVMPKRRTMQ
jgi:hypothetical protein